MAVALPPGIGNDQQAQQATAFMRQQPWYAQLLQSWGKNPAGDTNGNPEKLSDDQQQQLLQTAQANGIGISDKYQIDENGQIAEKPSHLLRNIAIGAGIGGLALTGFGAAGIGPLAGAFGAGTGAASTIGAAGELGDAAALADAGATGVGAAGTTLGGLYSTAAAPSIAGAVAKGASTVAGTPNIWSTIISGVGNLAGGLLNSNAAKGAAETQSNAALQAAQLNAQAQANSLAFQKQQWADQQANAAPFLKLGQGAANTLSGLMSGGGGAPATSVPPSAPSTTLGQVMSPTLAPSLPRAAVKLSTAPLQMGGARPNGVSGPVSMSSLYGSGTPAPDAQQAPPPQATSNPSYVRIKWPDGSSDSIPAGALPQYQLLGAQVNA